MWKWRWHSSIKNTDIKWTLAIEVSWEVHKWERHDGVLPGEQNLCFWQGPDNGLRSRRGRCSGSTSPAPLTPACACPMSEVFNFNHNLLYISWIFSQSFDQQFDFQNFANLVFLFDAVPFCNQDHAGRHRGSLASRHWTPSSSGSF